MYQATSKRFLGNTIIQSSTKKAIRQELRNRGFVGSHKKGGDTFHKRGESVWKFKPIEIKEVDVVNV